MMGKLGEELQARMQQSLEAEINFYVGRGLINKEEQTLIVNTFNKANEVASYALPFDLNSREILPGTIIVKDHENLVRKLGKVVEEAMIKLGVKATYDDSPWNGDAGQWDTAEAYCASCLIDMNEGSGPKTKDRCKLPYKKPGSNSINKGALRAMASGGRGLPALKDVPREQIVKAANFMIRHWQGAFDKPAPANIYRIAGKTPPEGTKESSTHFIKDKEGQWWMLGIYSNRWMDRDREILSEASHKEYADWVNKSGFKPQVIVYHLPKVPEGFWQKVWEKFGDRVDILNEIVKTIYAKTSLGQVEKIVYLNGFSIAISKIYPTRYEAAEKLSQMDDMGMSHGFLAYGQSSPDSFSPLKNTVNIIDKYRTFEVSILKRDRAANYGTAPIILEGKAVRDEDRKILADLLPKEVVDALDDNTKGTAEILDALLEHKELSDPEVPVPQEAEPKAEEVKAVDPTIDEEEEEEDMEEEEKKAPEAEQEEAKEVSEPAPAVPVEEVVKEVLKAINVEQLQTLLQTIVDNQKKLSDDMAALQAERSVLVKEVAEIKQTEDEKIAAKLSPINWAATGFAPSQSVANTTIPQEKAEQLAKAIESQGKVSPTGDASTDLFFNSILKNS
jgi:chorismate mutase